MSDRNRDEKEDNVEDSEYEASDAGKEELIRSIIEEINNLPPEKQKIMHKIIQLLHIDE